MSEKENFGHFVAASELANEDTYSVPLNFARDLRGLIGSSVDNLIRALRARGMEADSCDGAYRIEVALYEWIKKANPKNTSFATVEQLGRAAEKGASTPLLDPAVETLIAAAKSAEDRLGVLIECDNEDHGGAGEDDVAAFQRLRAALKPFDSQKEGKGAAGERSAPTPFEQFLASGKEVADLSKHVPDMLEGQPGIIYSQGLYIEHQVDGYLYLRLGNCEYADIPPANRRRLEAILYAWALSEGTLKDASKEQVAAGEAAHHICAFTSFEQRTRATYLNLRELKRGVCRVQDIADAWPILDQVAVEGTNLDLAYELMCGQLALE